MGTSVRSKIVCTPNDDTDDCDADDDDTSTHWHECRQGDCMNVLVWDVSRKSVVSFLVAKVEL